ncbi:ATP-binding protein [Bifidobacterium miconisargentati]|uniref:ATP-binding protein n=1 Tax=Bifidobacterium miconisargentati TaxID=2834437 RepID=UPI001BDBB7F7|nr:ATP-binding protein [Bifidobacterium miconisargentati]MBW3091146.1 ATP-binding protein [Bifidobacterium miconisargentati]
MLEEWKRSPKRKPLVLFGARQVGKTYAITHFARRSFDSMAYVDFSRDGRASLAFGDSIAPADVVHVLESLLRMRIDPERTLIVLDEVQLCERALTSLKYFCDDAPQYHVIAAGSLLGVKVNRSRYSFPVGKVDMLTLHPMDFEEYLWARGEERLADDIGQACATPDRPFAFHDVAMDLVREYMLVGGMPEAVDAYAESGRRMDAPREVQRDIVTAYTADMAKYASPRETQRILEAWNSVPRQLAKENHKFQYKAIRSGGRSNMYQGALSWLVSAGIITRLTQVSEPVAPLRAFEDPSAFKIYMADTGLLSCAYDVMPTDLAPANDKASAFRGALAENYVLQQLTAAGLAPHYWGTLNRGEVEFVVRDGQGDVIPIEVKSGANVTARSLTAYRAKYRPRYAVRISARNFGVEGDMRSVPLYAARTLADGLR